MHLVALSAAILVAGVVALAVMAFRRRKSIVAEVAREARQADALVAKVEAVKAEVASSVAAVKDAVK